VRCTWVTAYRPRIWRPEDEDELMWVLARSGRVGAALSLVAVVWALMR
jgi:hypothetical protein